MIKHISVIKTLAICMVLGVLLAFAVSCNQQGGRLSEIGRSAQDSLPKAFLDSIPIGMEKWYDDSLHNGEIRIDVRDSKANWDDFTPKNAPTGAPNILFVLYDDTGLGAWSPYGGKIKMPTLNSLAADGVTYTQWHTTALCSPTRSTIMTGRNHHLNGMASITESADGFPGANGRVPDNCVPFAKVLQDNGYSTFWVGKNHNVPETDVAPGGSRSEWPTQQGFDRFYGFLGGETNNWYPDMVEDNRFVEAPSEPIPGEEKYVELEGKYHLSKDLANKALEMLRNQQASNSHKPWYMWFNPGANHAPHHSPLNYSDIYKDEKTFLNGYNNYREEILQAMKDKGILPSETKETTLNFLDSTNVANPKDYVIPWGNLEEDDRALFVRMAEVYAGFSTYTDYHIGRIIDYLKETDQYENTIILYAADNGASGEGSPVGSINENKFMNGYPDEIDKNNEKIEVLGTEETYNHFPTGWAAAFSTPFKMFKRYAQFAGGTNDPLVIAWPKITKDFVDTIRHQYHHSVDIVPTLLDAIGIKMPTEYNGVKQKPLSGVSMFYTLSDTCTANTKTHKEVQYYSMLGTRGIWKDGWKAVELHAPTSGHGNYSDTTGWELYHVDVDRSESKDLADDYSEKLDSLIVEWYTQAAINNVLPLDDRLPEELFLIERPNPEPDTNHYRYYPYTSPVPEGVAVNIRGRSYTITAHITMDDDTNIYPSGVLFAHGSRFGGHTLYIDEKGDLVYLYNFLGIADKQFEVRIPDIMGVLISADPEGNYKFIADFEIDPNYEPDNEYDGYQGLLTLSVEKEGEEDSLAPISGIINTQPAKFTLSGDGLCVGYDSADLITQDYPNLEENGKFTFARGSLNYVEVTVEGEPKPNLKAEARRMMWRH